jgi:hypothetical protein
MDASLATWSTPVGPAFLSFLPAQPLKGARGTQTNMGVVPSNDELARTAADMVVCLDRGDLAGACALAAPWVRRGHDIYTRCDLDGSPPTLTPHWGEPLGEGGVRLFSTADPPEIACDIMLMSHAPPTREGHLMADGRVAFLHWRFWSDNGLLRVHCQADVDARPPIEHDFGLHANQALSALPGIVLEGMQTDEKAAAFLRTDARALPLLIACTQAGVQLTRAADYLLHHADIDADHQEEIVRALTWLSPQVLRDMLPRIDRAGLRGVLEVTLLSQLEQPRSWLLPGLSARLALFTSPAVDDRVFDILHRQSSPWIAWWLMAQAMEAVSSRKAAARMGASALEKLPTSVKTIALLARCGGQDSIRAVARSVAWMRREKWHLLESAEATLYHMATAAEVERLVEEAEQGFQQRMQSRIHSPR